MMLATFACLSMASSHRQCFIYTQNSDRILQGTAAFFASDVCMFSWEDLEHELFALPLFIVQ